MLVKLKGIDTAWKTLADGTRVRYLYAWRGGPLLKRADGTPIRDKADPQLHVAFAAAHAAKASESTKTVGDLIDLFLESTEFKNDIAPRTQDDYRKILDKQIRPKFGTLKVGALKDKRVRGQFKKWRDERAESSKRQADYGWSVIARVFSVAKDRGEIEVNPCERGGRIYKADRTDKIWSDEHEEAFLKEAPSHLHLALMLALWTGQRQGDLLRLTWRQYDGTFIRLRQSKTGKHVTIPAGEPLKAMLDAVPLKDRGERILLTTEGTKWTSNGFGVSFRKACIRAKVSGVTFHDTRGSAVTRLALAGCEIAEIATITGHSLADVHAILDAHYLSRDIKLAKSGIAKLEDHRRKVAAEKR